MLPQKLILVVEDNWLNREMLTEILSEQYRVLEAEHGQQALELLARYKDEVALILLDVMMPVMDGYTFLDRIKRDEELSLIPVIVMTQSDGEADEVSALVHGATDFLPKPYRPQVILHRVASIINLRETAAMVNQFQYDRMTGLYNKEFFYRKAREILLQNPEERYAIVSSDVENFKLFNDMFGMSAGNQLLREMAQYCMEQVGASGICGRISGDQFVALCRYDGNWGEERFTKHMAAINRMVRSPGSVSVKFGIYEITDPKVPVEYMCDRALLAADCIKGQYNRHFAVYDGELRSRLLREQLITDAMETALTEEQFQVYLQPKYSLDNDRLAGAEALVRWNHPEWGFLSPGEFIPLFEKNGFITRLDQYVWKRVCMLLRGWREKGFEPLPVSVNVSRADVYQVDLPETLRSLTREYGVDPGQLHLEITESAYTENPGQLISTVEQLRSMGFVIEMDDFGSGYSSLNMLNQMKLDVLKLDMKFIQNETAKPAEQGILRFIMDLARWMSLSVVAEGVENDAQLDRLREIGCDYVQGYLFARPMPSGDYEELLKERSAKGGVVVPKESAQEQRMRTLLVVDEDDGYREMVCKTFQGQYRLLEAWDLKSALACIEGQGHRSLSAVILSMTLPGQASSKLIERLRQDPMLRRTPILVTLPWGQELEERALDLDADDVLVKPHTPRGLRRRISHLMGLALYQEREQALQEEAYRDFLTGLLNRRGLHAAINGMRMEDRPVALYLFDLDNMKKVNDQYGHEAGDEMLRAFSEILRGSTRDGDILCRYGGDEFVVILKRISRLDAILKKGNEICGSFREYVMPGELQAACSGGIVLCPRETMPSDQLIQRADEALYRAKRENKGGCCLWQD